LAIHGNLLHTPHVFQSYVADERGVDIRVYVVGGKAVACCKRRNTTGFRSNVHLGGRAEKYDAPEALLREAERIATILGLDYGSVDFLTGESHVFVEANSNAYIFAIEKLGYNVAGAYADHIVSTMEKENARKNG
jgi:glutathione synthase/RimK-type ligase-like ATP-grasp enzyme